MLDCHQCWVRQIMFITTHHSWPFIFLCPVTIRCRIYSFPRFDIKLIFEYFLQEMKYITKQGTFHGSSYPLKFYLTTQISMITDSQQYYRCFSCWCCYSTPWWTKHWNNNVRIYTICLNYINLSSYINWASCIEPHHSQ